MLIDISSDSTELGKKAAKFISARLREIIHDAGEARMVVSTGSSQFEMFAALIKENVDWSKVEVFHLDEYIGLPVSHNASFRKYLYERFVSHVGLKSFHGIDVEGNAEDRIREITAALLESPIDLGLIGIGVNGHIAFNDPPADFETREAFRIVKLDNTCRQQQVDEGWFRSVDEVPEKAVSMTVFRIMQCKAIVSCVPHLVKADAVYKTLTGSVTNLVPATMLKHHPDFNLFLDRNSASKIISF